MTTFKLTKSIAALRHFAAPQWESREGLKQVKIRGNEAMSADGYIAAFAPVADAPDNLDIGFSPDLLKRARKLIKTGANVIKNNAYIRIESNSPKYPNDGEPMIDRAFPDTRSLMPSGAPTASVYVDPRYLETIGKAALECEATIVKLSLYQNPKDERLDRLRFEARGADGLLFEGLLMPMVPASKWSDPA
jgi:hypothetical protein